MNRFVDHKNTEKCLVHRFWFAAVLGRIDVYMGHSFCSLRLIMKMKTYLPAMNMAIVVIMTIMTMKKTLVNHTVHYICIYNEF